MRFILARYRCEIDGEPTGEYDYRVHWFGVSDLDTAVTWVMTQGGGAEEDEDGRIVTRVFEEILGADETETPLEGDAVIGFIADG